jgi:hypothetical protein
MSSPQAKWGTPDLPQIDRGRGAAAGLLARPTGRMGQVPRELPGSPMDQAIIMSSSWSRHAIP